MLRTHYISELSPDTSGEIMLAGWVHEIRDIGRIKFIQLRDRTGIVQVTAKKGEVPEEVMDAIKKLVKESVVLVRGRVKKETQAKMGFEIIPEEIKDLNPITDMIPFEVTGKVPVELSVRLDNRYIDLRRLETNAIFKIQHSVLKAFREKVLGMGFQEIRPPCIVAAATEGGADVFKLQYFEKEAFLAQSPQLYKQLCVIGGMDKVFMTTPVFRAEKHNTRTHLNEVLQMDIEMGFCDDEDAMNILEKVFLHILGEVREECKKELRLLGADIHVPERVPRHTYTECIEMLRENGVEMIWGDDFGMDELRKLCELIKDEAFFITEWPRKARAFYSMPQDKKTCKAFDLMYRGIEVASGAQRIHIPDVLVESLKYHGLDPDEFRFYIRAFRLGAPPHAGWNIGLERITQALCKRDNIRECTLFPRDRHRLTP